MAITVDTTGPEGERWYAGEPEPDVDQLRHHLNEMIETVQWMSGSADFGPDGQAHEGWLKAREKLKAAMDCVKA